MGVWIKQPPGESPAEAAAREAVLDLYRACRNGTDPYVRVVKTRREYRRVRSAALGLVHAESTVFLLMVSVPIVLALAGISIFFCGTGVNRFWYIGAGLACCAGAYCFARNFEDINHKYQLTERALARDRRVADERRIREFGMDPRPLEPARMLAGSLSSALSDQGVILPVLWDGMARDAETLLLGRDAILRSDSAVRPRNLSAALRTFCAAGGQERLPKVLQAAQRVHALSDRASCWNDTAIILLASSKPASPGAPVLLLARSAVRSVAEAAPAVSGDEEFLAEISGKPPDIALPMYQGYLWVLPFSHWVAAIRAIGPDVAASVRLLELVSEDSHGALYRFCSAGNGTEICMVRVQGDETDAGGAPVFHWLSVPRHMTTAAEAVAWTWGMSEKEYAPTVET